MSNQSLSSLRAFFHILAFLAIVGLALTSGMISLIYWILMLFFFVLASAVSRRTIANKIQENIGLAIIGGLVVSLYRDMALGQFSDMIIAMYISGFVTGIALLIIGAVGFKENNN